MELFGVGPLEALLVGIIAFLVVGPDKFPEIAREAGKWYRVARAFTADVMSDVQGAVKEIEAEVDASTGGGLRSIRELTESSTSLLKEIGADMEATAASAQAAIEPATEASEPASVQAIPPIEAAMSERPSTPPAVPSTPESALPAASNGIHDDAPDPAEIDRRTAAARAAAARVTGEDV